MEGWTITRIDGWMDGQVAIDRDGDIDTDLDRCCLCRRVPMHTITWIVDGGMDYYTDRWMDGWTGSYRCMLVHYYTDR